MDVTTLAGGVAAATHAASLLSTLAQTLKSSGRAEMIGEVIEVQLSLMNLLEKHQHALGENAALRARIQELEESFRVKEQLRFFHGAYWLPKADNQLDRPYSAGEWDLRSRLVRMTYNTAYRRDTREPVLHEFVCVHTKTRTAIPEDFLLDHKARDSSELKVLG